MAYTSRRRTPSLLHTECCSYWAPKKNSIHRARGIIVTREAFGRSLEPDGFFFYRPNHRRHRGALLAACKEEATRSAQTQR